MKKPNCPNFSSGPTAKFPGWSPDKLNLESVGRSHRSALGLARIRHMVDLTRKILKIPQDYKVALVPASCTGAMELAMWNLLGPREVDVLAWGVFGKLWLKDVAEQLHGLKYNAYLNDGGKLPDLTKANPDHDIIFTWNETTTGTMVPNASWIKKDRSGLVLCDVTSAAFAVDLDWSKLDATAFSWQKCMGGEGAHGIIVLSPRAIERIESYSPSWPMPRLFRITKDGKLVDDIFGGMTINTPSMLCIEDAISSLEWMDSIGGLDKTIQIAKTNFAAIETWVNKTPWIEFLVTEPEARAPTSICLKLKDISDDLEWPVINFIKDLLAKEGVAYDIGGHTLSVPCIRIWGGPTVRPQDIEDLLPWIDWAYSKSLEHFKIIRKVESF